MGRSILIVDDEELIRQGIRARIDYLGFKFDSIREADDGTTALSLLEQAPADVVITDIRMNDMDGIELIGKVKPLYPHIQFIILSGYAEFAYAEQAINLGVNAYLLKPISNEELKKTMNNVLERIELEEHNHRTVKLGEQILVENQKHIFEKNLNALLYHPNPLKGEGKVLFNTVNEQFPLEKRKFMTILMNIDGDSYEGNKFGYQDIKLIRFTIKNILSDFPSQSDKVVISNLSNTNQLFAILSNECSTTLRAEAEQVFSALQGVLWNRMQISISIGISSVTDKLSLDSTKEAQEAFQQRLIHGNGSMYFYDDIKLLSGTQLPTSELNMLSQYIERKDIGNIQVILNAIFSDECMQQYNVNYIRIVWVRIIGILLKSAHSSFEKEPQKAEQLVMDLDDLVGISSLAELREYLWTLVLDCLETDTHMDTNAKNKIKLATKYITDNYNKDIAINDLAERFMMSPNYFSSIFKKETGQTTINYIKELRINKAREYLAQSSKSVVDIAKEVGYEDSQYFFKVFKKSTGQTPLQYRKSYSKL
ncbi:response regulator transcription factor [Niameybacter massiliensis]|uniref:response regulator transcription factor n=1 Tax=Niameybacter massiliensis TaxID=1658108 RepID=UPI0006B66FC4|nr:response regulator [Niameybacter massiliensis]